MQNITREFIESSAGYIKQNFPRIEKCFSELNEDDIWYKPNLSSNSIGNLVLHLCGNITQYIISALGGKADSRDRDLEFSAAGGYKKADLLAKIKEVSDSATVIISSLDEEQLLRSYSVQGYEKSGIAIVVHVTEHFSYHTGQIVFQTKMMKDIDTGFYRGKDLNIKNK
ncbi:MAG TPA: DinB family protein [Ignavibacteria bacterium]|mgnify:FL=1|nr:hypothetical protein [Bacteroidota bacterium]HRE11982.1 DinB family protein [Ignavibacteria bacterium]HRF65786.1 DinB family protein [Ignavibacteria bacterium]HRJ03238.1 DinB family protein [Ignavibacteria bacterium]HRJ85163.1 DinB family protein [Ignavibacteria bacterium]